MESSWNTWKCQQTERCTKNGFTGSAGGCSYRACGTNPYLGFNRHTMIHTSRSKIVSHFQCPRYRFLKYHLGGMGVQKATGKHPTNAGLSIHKGNALLLQGGPTVDYIINLVTTDYELDFQKQFSGIPHAQAILKEQLCMIEGSIRSFNRIRLPQLRSLGEVVAIEQEQAVQLAPDLVYDFRADAIIRSPEGLIVIDFKPSPYGGYQWVRQWERNHQVLAYVWAAQQLYPSEPVLGVQIEGYVRGKMRFDKDLGRKIQQSPLCYVYENDFSGQIVPDYQRSSGWNRVPLWETSLSSKEYIEEFLTKEQVEGLFLAPVPPICPTPRQIDRWLRQTRNLEKDNASKAETVEHVRLHGSQKEFEDMMDILFPQNMDSCYKYGEDYPCECEQICFNQQVAEDPLASGLYEERVDHHTVEDDSGN